MPRSRRAKGEGSIFPVKDPKTGKVIRYGAYLTLKHGQKKYVYSRPVKKGGTQAEVAEKLQKLRQQRDAGVQVNAGRRTVAEQMDVYLSDVVEPDARPSTMKRYRSAVRTHIAPPVRKGGLGDIRVDELEADDVRAWLARKARAEMAPRTRAQMRALLGAAIDVLVDDDKLPRNVVWRAKRPATPRRQPVIWTDAQVLQFLQGLESDRLSAAYLMAAFGGMRKGEILAVRKPRLHLADPVDSWTQIGESIERGGPNFIVGPPKSEAGKRVVPLIPLVRAGLQRRLALLAEERLAAGPLWAGLDFVFVGPLGWPLWPEQLRRAFKDFLKRHGLPLETRVHDLRHQAATMLEAAGVSIEVRQLWLGHSEPEQSSFYTHPGRAALRDGATKFQAYMDKLQNKQ